MLQAISNKFISYLIGNKYRYRLFIALIALFFYLIFTINFYKSSTRVYSGTTYVVLPSKFYITKTFIAKNISTDSLKTSQDTIQIGSFLHSVSGKQISFPEDLFSILEIIPPDSIIEIAVINPKEIFIKEKLSGKLHNGYPIRFYKIRKSEIPENFTKFLNNAVYIGGVEFNGATYNAGIKEGDVLLSVKNKTFKMKENSPFELSSESKRFLRNHKGGQILPYKILRNNNIMTLNVKLATLGVDVLGLTAYSCGILFLITGLFYLKKKPQIFAARITGFAFMLISLLFTFTEGISSTSADYMAQIAVVLANSASFLVFPVFFHSLSYFPKEHPEFIRRKWLIRTPYYIGLFSVALFLFGYFYDFEPLYDSVFSLLSVLNILNIVFYITMRIWFRKTTSPDFRKPTRIISGALLTLFFVHIMIIAVQSLFPNITPVFLKYAFLIYLLLPVSYLYTTRRFRLLDIDFSMKMNVKYNIISVLLNTVVFLLFAGVLYIFSCIKLQFPNLKFTGDTIEYLNHPLDPELNTIYEKILIMLLVLLFAYLYTMILKRLKEALDKKFYRQKFDYKLAQNELIKLFETKKELNALAKSILEQLSEMVHLKTVGISFYNSSIKGIEESIYCYNKRAMLHSKPDLPEDIYDEIDKFNTAFDAEYLTNMNKSFLLENKFVKIIPIKTDGRLIASLFIGEKLAETALNSFDIEFLISISKNISVAIENAFLYEELANQARIKQELAVARKIQLSSLPQKVPQIEGLQISAVSIPAYEVGGDFYDFLNGTPNDVTVIIGDVSGKGTSAALYMSKVQGIFQTLHEFYTSPYELLNKANKMIFKNFESNSFITAISANINAKNKIISFSRAGHLPLYHYKSTLNIVDKITPKGMGLGLCKEDLFSSSLEEKEISFSSGDIFLFFSDGIIESKNIEGELFGEEKLEQILLKYNNNSSDELCNIVVEEVNKFSADTKQFDDITLVVVKCV